VPIDKRRIDELAALMREQGLCEAELSDNGFRVAFKKTVVVAAAPAAGPASGEASVAAKAPEKPAGDPISSPMTGIFYLSPSPSAPPFVREGEEVSAEQVVGLIEAMKVFNEITSPRAGVVERIVAKPGSVVNPGETLMYLRAASSGEAV